MGLFNRKGPSGFSSSSTAEEVTEGIDGSGLTAIVTGGSSGIGKETALILALRGVHVIVAVRNTEGGKEVKELINKENPNAEIDVMELDLSSLDSVRNFASQFMNKALPLDILINNAGVMAPPFTLSKDSIELQFATNYLGHFLLTNLLLDTMKKTAKESNKEGRIVNLSSMVYQCSYPEGIRFGKINDSFGYDPFKAYGQSKLANILHVNWLAKQLKEDEVNITINSIHPGIIITNLGRHNKVIYAFMKMLNKFMFKSIPQGAATTCYVALHPNVKGISGKYFTDNNISQAVGYANDMEMANKLWNFSMNLVK